MSTKDSAGPALNVLGGTLQPCSHDPLTGFYRDGFCRCALLSVTTVAYILCVPP